MIAVSRCVSLTSPDLGEKLFSGRNGKLIILLVWIYANLLVVPAYLGVSIYTLRSRINVQARLLSLLLLFFWILFKKIIK